MRKAIHVLLVASMMAVIASGCATKKVENAASTASSNETKQAAGDKDKPVTLTYWHAYTPDKQKVLKEFINKYKTVKPNVEIKEQFIATGEDMLKKIQVGLASNELPELAWGFPTWTGVLASSNKIVEVGNLMDNDMKKDFSAGALEANKYKGKMYSLPIEAGALVLIYNKDLFKAAGIASAPTNWDELLDSSKKLTKDGFYGVYLPIQPDERTAWTWETLLWQNGSDLVKDNAITFGGKEGVEAMQFYTDMIAKYKVAPKEKIDVDAMFNSGKLAMVIGTQGAAKAYLDKNPNVGVAPLPGKKQLATGLGTNTLFLFKSTPEKEKAAWEFMTWMTNSENNAEWTMKTGYVPVRISSVNTPAYKQFGAANPGHLIAGQSLSNGYTRPSEEWYPKMSSAISEAIEKVAYGKASVEDALKEAVQKSQTAMK
ncbi:multiple sugar transport system substrate-binding protein [Paenibacillus sp. yr247]|uniref:ABC transporter substrate-binding protein n=1 Tax=Paenibacillus sp. yr247 TaxID=1761880 RepID=UPI00088966EA|nr:ABC transporter substrate-binding protein [Paenibacillus sp. yr247]SDM79767.1 multiple sugar transport system substrate-binding protein [Paenibacillus sp. yr247]